MNPCRSPRIEHLLFLSAADLDTVAPGTLELVDLMETLFRSRATQWMVNPPKIFEHRSECRLYSAMVAFAPTLGFASCKWQSGDAENPERGLPLIQGLLMLSEDQTGQPVAVMDAKWITGERTAAASALVARHQARRDAATLSILGAGLQARKHLAAMAAVVPTLNRCVVYDIVGERAADFLRDMQGRTRLDLEAASDARSCVEAGDIVVTGAPIVAHPAPVIEPQWLREGGLGISIDYDASWRPDAIAAMDVVLCDDRAQLEDERRKGHFEGVARIDAELSELLHEGRGLRAAHEQRILAFNLGIALEDLALAAEVYRRAVAADVGTRVGL